MRREDISKIVHCIIKDKTAYPLEITDETTLRFDLELDSLEVIEIGLIVEKEFRFNRTIPDAAFSGFQTVGDLIDYTETELGQGKTAV